MFENHEIVMQGKAYCKTVPCFPWQNLNCLQ